MRSSTLGTVLAAACLLTACAKKAPETLPPPPGSGADQVQTGPTGPIPGTQADFAAQMAGQDTIYFETDRFNVDDMDAAALGSQANWLARYPQKQAVIEGHADERGTRDYNLALGERRANAAKNYLVSLGIGAERVRVVSYGKERPVTLGSNESAWARNRRAVTVTVD